MTLLPNGVEREWLLDRLAELVERVGGTRFAAAPIIVLDEHSFATGWEPTERAVRALARGLLTVAGLGNLDVELSVATTPVDAVKAGARARMAGNGHAAAWFAGIDGLVCRFGVDAGQLTDPRAVVGTMAHEVAHAFRAHHQLSVADREIEERLTDLTTVFLGFGVLAANVAAGGYLSRAAMSYLLGIQAVARGLDLATQVKVAAGLTGEAAASFRASADVLVGNPTARGLITTSVKIGPVMSLRVDAEQIVSLNGGDGSGSNIGRP